MSESRKVSTEAKMTMIKTQKEMKPDKKEAILLDGVDPPKPENLTSTTERGETKGKPEMHCYGGLTR